jgi:hypothetical protein
MDIYVVVGQTGEYSDRTDWYVCAYLDEAKATKHADEAMKWAVQNEEKCSEMTYETDYYSEDFTFGNPWDEDMQMQSRRTDYYVAAVEIREDLPVVE